jgi:alkylation response protein AidB-like acyl-CoA dehydrogenase
MLGVLVPEEYGGAGLGYYEYISTIVEVARICGSVGLSVAAHNSLCTGHILYFGNDEQKKKWLPKLATGQWLGAWALTEPNTGSDAMRMKCTARKEGNRVGAERHQVLDHARQEQRCGGGDRPHRRAAGQQGHDHLRGGARNTRL